MKILSQLILATSGFFCSLSFACDPGPTVHQAGTILGLANGVYAGSTSLTELLKNADMGLGTVNGAKGEMIILNGKVYLGDSKGEAKILSRDTKTPFAMAVQFAPTTTFEVSNVHDMSELEKIITKKFPSNNIFYAIKVEGEFANVQMRDIDPPTKPYIPLNTWIKEHQHILNLKNISGTGVLFRSPDYINPISVAGYHMHLITADHQTMGHVYDVQIAYATVSVEPIYHFSLMLPDTKDFTMTELRGISREEVSKVEKNN